MSVLDLPATATQAPERRPFRIPETETETENMPFAVNYDRPEPVELSIWLTLAAIAAALLVAIL